MHCTDSARLRAGLGKAMSESSRGERASDAPARFRARGPGRRGASDDEAHIRALLLHAMARTAQIRGLGRQDDALEQLVVRLSLHAGVSAVSWAVNTQILE